MTEYEKMLAGVWYYPGEEELAALHQRAVALCYAANHLPPERAYSKKDPLIAAMKEWVDREYEDGRQSVLSTQELVHKITELTHGELKWPGRNLQ